MNRFGVLPSLNCVDFVSSSRRFVQNRMGTMDSIMVLKDHSSLKYVHDSRFLRHSKDQVFIFIC